MIIVIKNHLKEGICENLEFEYCAPPQRKQFYYP